MNRLECKEKLMMAAALTTAALAEVQDVKEATERLSDGLAFQEVKDTAAELEAVRERLLAFLAPDGSPGLPVGDPGRADRPPAGTGSRRTGGIYTDGDGLAAVTLF